MREQTVKRFRSFAFERYEFDRENKTLKLHYSLDGQVYFTETYRFDFEFANDIDQDMLDAAIGSLFYMAGVSYYKTYLPDKIIPSAQVPLDLAQAKFFSKTYRKGLGEFFYTNELDPNAAVNFEPNSPGRSALAPKTQNEGLLVGIGGGKDSLVSVEILRSQPKVATWSAGHRPQLEPLVNKIGLPHFWVEREWDRSLLEHNGQGAYNGHVPISAILACVGCVVAALSGYRDVVVSNESSASEPTLSYRNVDINHQYSKSLEFEKDFQAHIQNLWGEAVRYYSLLRPFSELRISEMFASLGFEKYKGVFSSCNKAFVHTSHEISWCGECPKCAFVFLALTPFVKQSELEAIFGGKNLLLDTKLEPTYKQLLGIEGDKPMECVGEVKESRAAMRLAQKQYPELKKYEFDLPDSYDFRSTAQDSLPQEISSFLIDHVGK